MELKRKHRFIIALISLLFLLSIIQDTYAKYISNASANTNMSIARWSIMINNHDINNDSDFSNSVTPVFPETTHIAQNIIAPTSEGYFDITINASNVDVSFTETFTFSLAQDNTVTDLVLVGYSFNGATPIPFTPGSETITRNVLLSEPIRTYNYRIYVKWYEGDGEDMNNAADTEASKDGKASIKVNANFVQKPI